MRSPLIVTRTELGLRPPEAVNPAPLHLGTVVHWGGNPAVRDRNPEATWRGYQAYHMDARGWLDIAYNWGIPNDRTGRVFEGRGRGIRNGATGSGHANRSYQAVCVIAGADKGGFTDQITDEALWAIAWLHHTEARGPERRAHREFQLTSCPGDQLAGYVLGGAMAVRVDLVAAGRAPWDAPTPATPPEEDPPDMFEHEKVTPEGVPVHFFGVPAHGSRYDRDHVWTSKLELTALGGPAECSVWQHGEHVRTVVAQVGGAPPFDLAFGGQVSVVPPSGKRVVATVRYGKARWDTPNS